MVTDTFSPGMDAQSESRSSIWLGQTRSFVERYVRELFRNKTVLFWSLLFPVGFYLLTITVFVPTDQIPADVRPLVFASTAIGYGTFGAVIACLNSFGQQLAADFEADRYKQFRALPIRPTADLFGRMIAGLTLAATAFAVVVVVSLATGAEYAIRGPASLVVGVVALVGFGVFWMVLSVALVVLVDDERYATIVTVAIALLSYMLTGFNGTDPSSYTGPDALLNYLPNTLSTRILVYHFVDVGSGTLAPPALPGTGWSLAVLTVYAVVSLALGVAVVRRFVYKQGVIA